MCGDISAHFLWTLFSYRIAFTSLPLEINTGNLRVDDRIFAACGKSSYLSACLDFTIVEIVLKVG
jgi:hypothetical protein